MKRKLFNSSRRYQDALRNQMKQGRQASLASARSVGGLAHAAGLQTLDLAKLHEQTLVTELLPGVPAGKRAALIKQAGSFFAEAILPLEKPHASTQEAAVYLRKIIETLSQRTVELAASNLELSLEIGQRKAAEAALKKSERHYSELLAQSDRLQEQLRQLSRQILLAQEEERREISRELHDVIAQTLTGINVRLAALSKEAATNTKGLDRNIARTQRLVEKSVDIVHRFARELAPGGAGRSRADSRAAFVHEKFHHAHRRPHAFDGLCGRGRIGNGPAHGAVSRRPGSAHECRPPCQSQPRGSEPAKIAGWHLHEN